MANGQNRGMSHHHNVVLQSIAVCLLVLGCSPSEPKFNPIKANNNHRQKEKTNEGAAEGNAVSIMISARLLRVIRP
jgi:predicted component of type VI protein secretion system